MLITERCETASNRPDNKDGGNQLMIPTNGSSQRNSKYVQKVIQTNHKHSKVRDEGVLVQKRSSSIAVSFLGTT